MFMPITLTYLCQQINKINWRSSMQKLDNSYIFKFSIFKFVNSNMSNDFFIFLKIGVKLITLQTYIRLIDQRKYQYEQWLKQIKSTSQAIRGQYCQIVNKVQRDKFISCIDLLIFLTCLHARQFLQQLFNSTKIKQNTNVQNRNSNSNNSNNSNNNNINNKKYKQKDIIVENNENLQQNQNQLLIQQYAFIIITYQITGNLVNPCSFEHLRKKYIQRKIYQQKSTRSQQIVQSLKYIKENIRHKNQNQIYLSKIRARQRQRQNDKIQPFIKQILKMLLQQNNILSLSQHKKIKKLNKIQKKTDKISKSLHLFLNTTQQKQENKIQKQKQKRSYTKLQKINHSMISKAVKLHFNIDDYRNKQKQKYRFNKIKQNFSVMNFSEKKQKFLLNFHQTSVNQSYHRKNKRIQNVMSITKQNIQNWPKLVEEMKRKYQKTNVQIEKFDCVARLSDIQQKQCLSKPKLIQSASIQNQQKKRYKFLPGVRFTENLETLPRKSSSTFQLKNFNRILLKVQQKGCLNEITHKFNDELQNQLKQEKKNLTDFHKLRKKVLNVKMHKKAFDQKCNQRKTAISVYRY